MNEAIKISGLKKSYGAHVVLNGLDFCVRQGEIFALLGVNGAGKTTSLEPRSSHSSLACLCCG